MGGRTNDEAATSERRIDVGGVTLAWGDAARWKARFREESARAFAGKPLADRLRAALALVRRRDDGTSR